MEDKHHVKTEETSSSPSLKRRDELCFTCPQCEKSFSCKKSLDIHIKFNLEGFSDDLKDQLKCYTKDKPYVCNLCGKSFSQMNVFTMHQIRHSGVKDHVCSECGKTFFTDGALKVHLIVHTTENTLQVFTL